MVNSRFLRPFLLSCAIQLTNCLAFASENSSALLQTPVRGVTVAGDFAYLAAGAQGLVILDVKDPAKPRKIGSCDTHGEAWNVAISQGRAFVANGVNGLAIVDVADAANPSIIGSFNPQGNVISVAVTNGLAYLIDNWNGLRILNVSQPQDPKEIGFYGEDILRDVAISGKYAYLASNLWGLEVMDVSDPANLRSVGIYSIYGHGFGKAISLSGKYAYFAADYTGLIVLDLTNPTAPVWAGQCEVPGFPVSVSTANGYAYLASGVGGLNVVDVRNAGVPHLVANYKTPGTAFGVAATGTNTFVADGWAGLQIVNVSQPDNPAWIAAHHTAFEPKGLAISTNAAFAADPTNGLKLFALSTSAPPQLLRTLPTTNVPKAITVSGRYAYLAEGPDGLQVVDLANLTNATVVSSLKTLGEANGLVVSGSRLYVANGPTGLAIFDVQNAAQPKKIGALPLAGSANGIALDGTCAMVADGKEGLILVDVTDPTAPRILGGYDTFGDARGVVVSGNYAYLSAGWTGLEVIDVSDRTKPRRVGAHDTPGFAMSIAISSAKAYVADNSGFSVFDISAPSSPRLLAQNHAIPALNLVPGEEKLFTATRADSLLAVEIDLSNKTRIEPILDNTSLTGLRLTGPYTEQIIIQSSADLRNWIDHRTVAILDGATNVAFTNAIGTAARYYRAYAPPAPVVPDIPQIILDSDLGVDADDLGDIALLHKFADMGLCNIVAMTYGTQIPYGASALDAINTAYGRGNIPIGTCTNTWDLRDDYDQHLAEQFPTTLKMGTNAPNAVRMLRQLLANAAPHSLTIIQASYIVNLAQVVISPPDDISPLTGEELLNEKVKLLAISAGDYPSGTEVYFRNVPTKSAIVVNSLKCPMIFSGESFGQYIHTAYLAQLRQFMPTNFIIRVGLEDYYRKYSIVRREAWAQSLIWYVIAGPNAAGQKLFDLEYGGYNFVDEYHGGNSWGSDQLRDQAYLVPVAREADIAAAITSLMYLPPGVQPKSYDPYVNLYAQLVASNGGSVNDSTLKALDEYVKTLKSDGTWDQKRLIWPCAGNDLKAASCLLKFPLGYSNGIMPIVGNPPTAFVESQGLVGTGQFQLDTLASAADLGMRIDTCHLALYSLRDVPGQNTVDCGRYDDAYAAISLSLNYGEGYTKPFFDSLSVFEGRVSASQAFPTVGFYVGNRTSLTNSSLYRNQTLLATTTTSGGVLPPNSLLLYAYQPGASSARTYCHFSCGPGLTPSQMATDARAVQALQRALNRALPE